ncbi:MAG: hypothetical protein IIB77_01875 [Proteobacteria bacterium]|nr:hypothetical protein [Pseudomonadota bacterium]
MNRSALNFVSMILTLALRHQFSISSWGRTVAHNRAVEGHENSRHLLWQAVDCTLDDMGGYDAFYADAIRMGLVVVREGDHVHVQMP